MRDPVRWGVLSTAKFALNRWLPSFGNAAGVEGVAIASRDIEKALSAAERFGFARAYGNYDALLADPDVEAVYIPLPNGLHGIWSLKALQAGKHVLVEKPAWNSAAEGREVAAEADRRGLRLMEAFTIRHHARWKRIVQLLEEGAIGDIRSAVGAFCFTLEDEGNVRWDPTMAGGALADVGCYPVNAARLVFGEEPMEAVGHAHDTRGAGVDSSFEGSLLFPSGRLDFRCSFEAPFEQAFAITGSNGTISVNRPFICRDEPVVVTVAASGREPRDEHIELGDQYIDEIAHLSGCVRDPEKPMWPGEDGVAGAAALDALRESARGGIKVMVGG